MNSELKGKVKTITEFGVFVDVGLSSDGLVHKSQLSDTFVANVEDLGFEPGQEVRPQGQYLWQAACHHHAPFS